MCAGLAPTPHGARGACPSTGPAAPSCRRRRGQGAARRRACLTVSPGSPGRAQGRLMWEELGVTGMLSHIGWAFSTGDEAARQSSPTASCDTADVPSRARSSGAGLAPGAGPQHLWAAPQPPGPAVPPADRPAPPQSDPEGHKALVDLFGGKLPPRFASPSSAGASPRCEGDMQRAGWIMLVFITLWGSSKATEIRALCVRCDTE